MQTHVLKVGVLDVGFKSFSPQEEALVLNSLSCGSQHWRKGTYEKIVSQPLLLTFLLICLV